MQDEYEALRLCNQLCFPLYACSKEITRAYKPMLDELNLTYTQYIVMMVLWEHDSINVKTLGDALLLDSGTLTPVLKKLEQKGYITRERAAADERNLEVRMTELGGALKEKASKIPARMSACMSLTDEEMKTMYALVYKLLKNVRKNTDD